MMNSADTLVPLSTIDSLGKQPELRMLNDIKGKIEIIFSISIIWLQNFIYLPHYWESPSIITILHKLHYCHLENLLNHIIKDKTSC